MRKRIIYIIFLLVPFLNSFSQQTNVNGQPASNTGRTFAIILGISDYKYIRPLSYADNDAELFRDFLKSPGGGKLADDNIFCTMDVSG